MEVQLKQTEKQLSKQIAEECQAVQLRSGKTLNTSLQSSRKPRNEQMATQNPSEDSKSPERNNSGVQTPETSKELASNSQWKLSSGIQMPRMHPEESWRWTPETSMKLAFNARNMHYMGVERPERAPMGVWTPEWCTKAIYMPIWWRNGISFHLRICGPHRIPTYHISTFSFNPNHTLLIQISFHSSPHHTSQKPSPFTSTSSSP